MSRPRSKSRRTAEKVRVVVHIPELDENRDAHPPGYSGHNGGQFEDAGFAAGRGQFGFHHHVLQS